MQTVTLLADFPAKGQTKMANKMLVRGNERKRLRKLLKVMQEIEGRDGKVTVVPDLGNFKGQLIIAPLPGNNLPNSFAKIKQRVIDLLAART